MKIAIFGKTPERKAEIASALRTFGFTFTTKKPELVISYGGDGTFLWAERTYPQVPKALFRASTICKKCHNLPIDHALSLIKSHKYRIDVHRKLLAKIKSKRIEATNDIVIRNKRPTHALRFRIAINGALLEHEFIGDGIVVATTFGSGAYFHSITRRTFDSGIGLAFNNTTLSHAPLFLPESAHIELHVTRGEALLASDNNPAMLTIKEGDTVVLTSSKKVTRVVTFD